MDENKPDGGVAAPTPMIGGERSLAPDLSRGLMLLLIVLSNTGFHLYSAEHGPTGWHPIGGGLLDKAAQFLMILGLDMRVYPLFAFLLGYGMVQFFERQTGAGMLEKRASAMLRRRSLLLIVFGFFHAALLMAGDILGAYGVMTFFLGWLFIRRSQKTVLIWAGVAYLLLIALGAMVVLAHFSGELWLKHHVGADEFGAGIADPIDAARVRIETWLYFTPMGGLLGFASHACILLGFWAARRRVLESPGEHRRLLWTTAVVGVAIGWLGGLPTALGHLGVIEVSDEALYMEGPLFMLQVVSGVFGGLGYAAALTLLAHRLQERGRTGLAVRMASAIGKRSLSSYLAFSVVFAPLLAAWGLGLGARMTSFTMVLFGVGVWLAVGAWCMAMERRQKRGPAEAFLRRLVYGRGFDPASGVVRSRL